MQSKFDNKLSQQVRVLLERLPNADTPLLSKNVKTNKLHKNPNYEAPKVSKKEDFNIKESSMPPSVKKEKKVFEVVDSKIGEFSKIDNSNYYSNYVKSEKIILDPYKNTSLNIGLNRVVTSKPKEWFIKETKIKKETKECIKDIIESNISHKRNLRKRPYSSKCDSERNIQIQNKVQPLIELVPLVVKIEEPEIRTVKKIQRKTRNVIEIDNEADEKFTPSIRDLVSQNASITVDVPLNVFKMCKSIPHSSKKELKSQRDSRAEETPANKGAVGSSHETLGRLERPDNVLVEEIPSSGDIAEFSLQTLKKPENDHEKEDYLNGCTVESSRQTMEKTDVGLLEEAPANKYTVEANHKTLERPGEGSEYEASKKDSAVEYIHQTLKKQEEGTEALPQDQTFGKPDVEHLVEEDPLSGTIAEFSHQTLEKPEDGLLKKDSLNGCTVESSHQTLGQKEVDVLEKAPTRRGTTESSQKSPDRPGEGSEDEVSKNDSAVEYIHQTWEKQGNGTVSLPQDQTLGRPDNDLVEEGPSNGGIAKFSHHTLEKPEVCIVKEHFLNGCIVESSNQMLGRTEISILEEAPINRGTGEGPEDEASKNDSAVEYIHQTPERLRENFEDESSTNGSTADSGHQTLERPGVNSPLDFSQRLNVQLEPTTMFLNTDSTIRSGITSDNVIKVKAPQALGIQRQDLPQNTQNTCSENRLNISHLNQITSTSGNESRIAEICKVYPIFFTLETRRDISVLIQILYKASRGLTFEQIKSKRYDETYLLNIQNCGKTFVTTFNRVLKLDYVGLDRDLLKKIIPILYLQMDKAFKRLRPEEDFDFRIIMKKVFEAESFICDHDVILEKNYEMFQKVMITFDRWLEDIFIECDLSDTLEPVAIINNVEDDNLSLSGRFSPDSLEDTIMELEDDNLATSEQQIGSTVNTRTQDITVCDVDVELNYLQCLICRNSLPLCYICKELLSCPCLSELHKTLAFDRGPGSLFFCREHASCGDSWPQWLEDWIEEREDHDMPLNPICWNSSCSNKAELLCICRIQAYCSLACQVEDWYEEHYKSCRKQSDPKSYFSPREEDMDLS